MIQINWPKMPDKLYSTDFNNNKIEDVDSSCVTPVILVSPGRSIQKVLLVISRARIEEGIPRIQDRA